MYGGVSQVMHLVVPAVPVKAWVFVFLALTLALLLGGGYARVERIAMVKVALFTVLTALAAARSSCACRASSPGARSPTACSSSLPPAGLGMAVAVFGITGVGAAELFMYPYWCVEKGYAQFTGPRDGERRVGAPRARMDPRDALRHRRVDDHLHRGDRRLLPARRRRPARHGARAGERGHDSGALQSLHADAGRLGAGLFYRRRHRHAVRHGFRRHRRALASVRRHVPAGGRVRGRTTCHGGSRSATDSSCCSRSSRSRCS